MQCGSVYDRKREGDERASRHVVVEWGKRSKKVKVTAEVVAAVLGPYGTLTRTELGEGGRCAFASFASVEEARSAVDGLDGAACERLRRRVLRLAFADLIDEAEREARYLPIECTSETASVEVPGLEEVEGWVTEEEEAALVAAIDAAPWDARMRRRVQHYGYRFDYVRRAAWTEEPLGPLPGWLASLRDRVAPLFGGPAEAPDQFTVNEYPPGEGISQHVDTPEAFGPVLATLSLGSDAVMGLWSLGASSRHRNVPLRRRSLTVFRGEARHWWTHGIARRRVDVVDGRTQRRGRRLSVTMRRVRQPPRVGADVPPLPAVAAGAGHDHDPPRRSALTRLEREHVHKVYEAIAPHFSSTRYAPWPRVSAFLERLPPGALIADVGCGNGKYMGVLGRGAQVVGCDFSPSLLTHAAGRGHEVAVADAQAVPLRGGAFDACICIAVLHHIATVERRVRVLAELARLLRPGGRALVYVWAMEQEGGSRRQFAAQDVLVPWSLARRFSVGLRAQPVCADPDGATGGSAAAATPAATAAAAAAGDGSVRSAPLGEGGGAALGGAATEGAAGGVVYHRFCHVYCEGEVEGLLARVPGTEVVASSFDTSNWCVEFERVAT